MKKAFYTVYIFAKINTFRYFRDPVAIFFTVAFPLIFMFVIGGIFGKSEASFRIVLINESDSSIARQFTEQVKSAKTFKLNSEDNTLDKAKEKMKRGELDAAIVLPKEFGATKDRQPHPSGQAVVYYTQNNQQAGQTLASVLEAQFKQINTKFVQTESPFTVRAEETNDKSLSTFDYTFAGLLGFSILGLGIFGPANVFPELKRAGVLRRFSTTPIKVWQYFLSNVITQALIGLFTMTILVIVAMLAFRLSIVGNVLELAFYLMLSTVTILGIGLSLGGWAKNQRQAAPLTNLVTFPMMFLSGTFFPRFLMPEWLQQASSFLPLTPIIDGIRLIATEGKHLTDLLPQLGLIGVWMIIIYFVAFRVFRWE